MDCVDYVENPTPIITQTEKYKTAGSCIGPDSAHAVIGTLEGTSLLKSFVEEDWLLTGRGDQNR